RLATRGTTFAAFTFALLALAFAASAGTPQDKGGQPSKDGKAQGKVGVSINDAKAFKGYTLFSPMNNTKTYLIDNDGKVVNAWQCDCEPGETAVLLPNGNLLRAGRVSTTK